MGCSLTQGKGGSLFNLALTQALARIYGRIWLLEGVGEDLGALECVLGCVVRGEAAAQEWGVEGVYIGELQKLAVAVQK